MKKIFLIVGLAGILFSACEKDPDFDKLSSDLTVYSDYTPETDFSGTQDGQAVDYYLPDSVLVPGNGIGNESFMKPASGDKIIGQIASNMKALGFNRLPKEDKDKAHFGLQVSFVNKTTNVTGIMGGYNPWWSAGFWGGWWSGFYYPSFYYPVSYSYNTGSLVIEMVDLSKKNNTANGKNELPIVWRGYATGLMSGNSAIDMQLVMRSIDQSFRQAPFSPKEAK